MENRPRWPSTKATITGFSEDDQNKAGRTGAVFNSWIWRSNAGSLEADMAYSKIGNNYSGVNCKS
jgi:hypothetical protein